MKKVAVLTLANGAHLELAKVPDSAKFTFAAPRSQAEVVSTRHPGDARYSLTVRVKRPTKLALRITDVPGWHVTADGRPLAVHGYEGSFLEVTVPAGTHTVVAYYWPRDFTYGIVLALLALLALVLWPFLPAFRRLGEAALASTRRRAAGRRPADGGADDESGS
jgi:hypothetical protein